MTKAEDENKIDLKSRRTKHDGDFDITPMIDCVFLLLFFFMVTSKMDQQSSIEQPLTVNGVNLPPEKLVIVSAAIGPSGEALFYLGDTTKADRQVPSGEIAVIEDAIKKYVELEVSQRPDVQGILIKADGKLKQKYAAMFYRAATASAGGRKLYAGTQQE